MKTKERKFKKKIEAKRRPSLIEAAKVLGSILEAGK